MAPNRGPQDGKGKTAPSDRKTSLKSTRGSGSRVSKKKAPRPPPKQQKTKAAPGPVKRKKRVYTDKELGVPQLNMITPVGVQKPKGKKKGKIFVDDAESMMTILAMVNADKEGQIESKMMKARQMEEIREARKAEAEKKEEMRKGKLEETKDSLRKKRGRKDKQKPVVETNSTIRTNGKTKKRVSFG